MLKRILMIILASALVLALASCAINVENVSDEGNTPPDFEAGGETPSFPDGEMPTPPDGDFDGEMPSFPSGDFPGAGGGSYSKNENSATGGAIDTTDIFTKRDLECSPDLSDAEKITLKSGEDVIITKEGIYALSGSVKDVTVIVSVGEEEKVQLVLDGVSITNEDAPAIYVKSADKVFVTTTDSKNSLTVSGEFTHDGEVNTDAVIFSKEDLVLNGVGTLSISSTANGVTSKDDLKVTGGTLNIKCTADALEVNDSIRIADGNITISSKKDGIHAENSEDNALGYVYISGGTLDITADDDGIHGTTIVQIDGGDITIKAAEGIEGTWVQINGGNINIEASDDGINGAKKSTAYTATVEINDGDVTIKMGEGDTDGIDSNGNLFINGGTVDITCQSPFDYDGTAEHNGGTIIVNGEVTDTITNQFGGGMPGGQFPGGQGDQFPGGRGGQGGQFPGRR